MDELKNIKEEISTIAPLVSKIGNAVPFQIPKGYFEHLPSAILDNIYSESAQLTIKTETPYSIPDGYFNRLTDSIFDRIKLETLADNIEGNDNIETPILPFISKVEVNKLLEGNIEQEQKGIFGKLKSMALPKPGTIRHLRRWVPVAAAAIVGGILVTAAFLYTDSKSYLKGTNHSSGAMLTAPINPLVDSVDSADADQTIEEETPTKEEETTMQLPKQPEENKVKDFSNKIQIFSDEEIKKYLEENSVPEPVSLINDSSEI